MRQTNSIVNTGSASASTPQHHPPRTSTLSIAATKTTTTAATKTINTTTKSASSKPTNASPRVSLPPPSRPRRPASTIGTIDATPKPKRASSTLSTNSTTSSKASSTVSSARPLTSLPNRTPLVSSPSPSATPRLALRARDRNAALSSRPATPRFPNLKPQPSPSPRSTLSTLSTLSSFSQPLSPSPLSSPAMGYDKDTPRKPTLASRPFTRAPLTPKIAASSTPARTPTLASNSSHNNSNNPNSPYQTVTVSTPLARRVTGLSSASGSSGNHYHNDTTSPAGAVPSYLNNVTPRSGSRQSRVDGGSATTTPTGTPNGHGFGLGIGVAGSGNNSSASSAADPDSKFFYASEAKSSSGSGPSATASHSTPSLAMASPSLAATPSGRPASTFFYANGKSLPSASNPGASQSTSGLPAHVPPPAASPTLLSTSTVPGPAASKFVHANGAALERKLSSSSQSARRTSAATSTIQQQQSASSSRPLSPVKMASVAPYPLQKSMSFPVVPQSSSTSSSVNGSTNTANSSSTNNANASASASTRPSVPNSLPLNAAASAVGTAPLVASPGPVSPGSMRLDPLSRQRSNFSASIGSIGSNSSAGSHSRKGSLTIADPPTVARLLHSSQPNSEVPSPASGQCPAYPFPSVSSPGGASTNSSNATGGNANAAASSGLAAILQAADDFAEDEGSEAGDNENGEGDDDAPPKDSRRSSTNSSSGAANGGHTHSQVDELVTMARRERKVQDLEITNASLEAINRSLERQLRKQKNELRQFRRLSRSGRLSLAPSTMPGPGGGSRITSSSTVEGPMQDMDQLLGDDSSFLNEFDEEYGSDMEVSFNEDEDENDDDSSSYDEGDTRRKRDERRLQLDLAQHRQLLVDSQKINQSIKRCMNWTEALIQEGQKALAFQVRVSEVQLGGRVLAADEVEERQNRERAKANMDPSERSALLLKESEMLLEKHDDHDGDHDDDHDDLSMVGVPVVDVPAAETKGPLAVDTADSTTANTSASTSASSDHDGDSRDEAFSPINHNVRTVRFDTGDGDAKTDVTVEIPSLDSVVDAHAHAPAPAPEPEASVDAAPSTPSKPPSAPVVQPSAPMPAAVVANIKHPSIKPAEPAPSTDNIAPPDNAAPPDASTTTPLPQPAAPADAVPV